MSCTRTSALACALLLAAANVFAQQPGARGAAQLNDENYTARIREYTTDKVFSTELVDHLPSSPTVPSPDKILGYVVGAPNKLTHVKDVHRYMRALDEASPRVRVFVAPEKSEEGREQILVAISDEARSE